MDMHQNILFLGSPGVGKSHLAITLGVEACLQEKRTLLFIVMNSCYA